MSNPISFDKENLKQLISKKFILVILISIPSAIVADFFNIPLAWMIGPMIATSLVALKGFQVLGTVDGHELSDPSLDPVWETAQKLDTLIFIHPNGYPQGDRLKNHYFNELNSKKSGKLKIVKNET